jgi:hypothetical protein
VIVTVPVASNAQPAIEPPTVSGWQFVAVPVWFRMSIRKTYGEPYGKFIEFVLVRFPVFMSKVTIPYCRTLFSFATTTGTPVGSSLAANVPSPA